MKIKLNFLKTTKLFTFIRNVFWFRKELSTFQNWDYSYNLLLFKKSLELLKDSVKNGDHLKAKHIERLIEILDVIANDSYFDIAKKELNISEDQFDKADYEQIAKISKQCENVRNRYFNELSFILKGKHRNKVIEVEKDGGCYGIESWWI